MDNKNPTLAFEFDFHAHGYVGDELVPVGVDFLNVHGRDDHAHLAEDDVLREFLDVLHVQAEHALCGVFHDTGFRGNAGVIPDMPALVWKFLIET